MTPFPGFRFDNPVLAENLFTRFWQSILSSLMVSVNSRRSGVTDAIANGTVINHNLGQMPRIVMLSPQDATPTNYYADTLTVTSFTLHYSGGGLHAFGWSVET